MAFRYFIRYLASSAWAFILEFRNFLFLGSFLAFVGSFLQLHCVGAPSEWFMKLTRSHSCCFPRGPKPWCYLGWVSDDDPPAEGVAINARKVKGAEVKATRNNAEPAVMKRFAPLVVVMVGLPARGKSITALKLARYLTWIGHNTKVFSLSVYRRTQLSTYSGHDLFNSTNMEGLAVRRKSLAAAMADAEEWLQGSGEVAILDGTHATRTKRQWVHDHFTTLSGFQVLFVECVCDQEEQLTRNVREMLKKSPDYSSMNLEQAIDDFQQKAQHYNHVYQSMRSKQDQNLSYIKHVNGGDISVHRVHGQLQSNILTFMSNFSTARRTIYFSRHGESEYNVVGRIGGDTNLSPRGQLYGKTLARHINDAHIAGLHVWTSQLRRTKQTAQAINADKEALPALNELDAGVCEGLTYEEMAEKFPQEFAWRDQDKLRYRYPWGESYIDIMTRVQPVLLALESEDNVLVVSHQAVLRCMLGYLMGKSQDEVPYMDVPLHTIMKVTTNGFDYEMELIKLPVECVDTYRKQPENCSSSRSIDDALLTLPAHFEAHFDTNKMWQMMGTSSLLN